MATLHTQTMKYFSESARMKLRARILLSQAILDLVATNLFWYHTSLLTLLFSKLDTLFCIFISCIDATFVFFPWPDMYYSTT